MYTTLARSVSRLAHHVGAFTARGGPRIAPRRCCASETSATATSDTSTAAAGPEADTADRPRPQKTRLGRSFMYVPADKMRMIDKVIRGELQPDIVVIDCEDGVHYDDKQKARDNVAQLFSTDALRDVTARVMVRVNSRDTPFVTDDLVATYGGTSEPDMINLPKVHSRDDLLWLAGQIQMAETVDPNNPVPLAIHIESAEGVLNAVDVCRTALESPVTELVRLQMLIFGSDDLCASLGIERSEDASELLYARQKIVCVAKAFGLEVIDKVETEIKDLAGLERESLRGHRMGFTGKQVIHPSQLPTVHRCFTAPAERLAWAAAVLSAFHAAGEGAVVVQGHMVDAPTVKIAQRLVDMYGSDGGDTTPANGAAKP